MPTVLRVGPYRFAFFSSDRMEPVHVHVLRDRQVAKFWLNPVAFGYSSGFKKHELHRIARLVGHYEKILIEAWHDYFDS
jgi:hypothetical protein